MEKRLAQIESLLLAAGRPIKISLIAKLVACTPAEAAAAVEELQKRYNVDAHGIQVLVNNEQVQLATNPSHRKLVADFIKDETTGELTKPSLETLTIIAYRQPITKEELEQIRGVNCSLILRNLMIRGLVESEEQRGGLTTVYNVTMDFLRFLGITSVKELADFERLNSHESLQAMLAQKRLEAAAAASGAEAQNQG